jgi:hypothetical protein
VRILVLTALLAVLAPPLPAHAASCTTAAADCAEWIVIGPDGSRSRIYRTHPLDASTDRITRALVVVHDIDRDAQEYFRIGVAAAMAAGALDETLVIAPRFASRDGVACADALAPHEANWPCDGNSWRSGGTARGGVRTSFDLADEILRNLARKNIFPNLRAIVLAGHSAGGQFVTRYQMTNRVHETLGVPVTYVVANPSSYAYPDPSRPLKVNGATEFRAPHGRSCDAYDRWPYGLADRTGYAGKASVAVLRKQLVSRPATYLLGAGDVLPVDAFDTSCAAMAQGTSRLERGRAFADYVNTRLGGRHRVVVVPRCGHDARCVFTAKPGLEALFPN